MNMVNTGTTFNNGFMKKNDLYNGTFCSQHIDIEILHFMSVQKANDFKRTTQAEQNEKGKEIKVNVLLCSINFLYK